MFNGDRTLTHESIGKGCVTRIACPPVETRGTDQQLEDATLLVELGRDQVEQLGLVLAGVGPGVEHVVQHGRRIQAEALRDCAQPVGSAVGEIQGNADSKLINKVTEQAETIGTTCQEGMKRGRVEWQGRSWRVGGVDFPQ